VNGRLLWFEEELYIVQFINLEIKEKEGAICTLHAHRFRLHAFLYTQLKAQYQTGLLKESAAPYQPLIPHNRFHSRFTIHD
jgi:hypothetical protein